MKNHFTYLFSSTTLGLLSLKNRLVRSATFEGKADENGHPTELNLDFYRRLAEGGVGLIITGLAYPEKEDKLPRALNLEDDSYLDLLSKVQAAIHSVGNECKVVIQIGHTGRQVPLRIDRRPVAPSPNFGTFHGQDAT